MARLLDYGFNATASRKGAKVAITKSARVNHKIPIMDDVLPRDQRACFGMEPELFVGYDHESTSDRIFREEDAKSVCAGCPLKAKCLQWAMDHRERGVWGGMTDDDRKYLRIGRTPPSLRDPSGRTKQQVAREARIKIAKNLLGQGIDFDQIAKELKISVGTVYDYFRSERKSGHGATDSRSETEAEEEAQGSRSPDTERPEAPVLKEQAS